MQDFTDEKIQCGRCNGPCHCGLATDKPWASLIHHSSQKGLVDGSKFTDDWALVTCETCQQYRSNRKPYQSPTASPAQPLFEQRAGRTIGEATATFGERGAQYGDTWRNCQWLVLKASLRELGHKIPDDHLRAIAAAAFVDMKYQRYEGGYRRDNGLDGINYTAFHADEMRELKEGGK